jgi:hypothetical protein
MQKVILIGNLGKDPEVKSFDNGGKVANFSVGVTERGYTTKDGKNIPEHTEWFNCVVRQSGLAGVAEQYLKKGNNKIEIILKSSLRNLFGPHHFKPVPEPFGVSPICFTMRGLWGDGDAETYAYEYFSVPFGVNEVEMISH